jgi:hypothetical protein
MSAEARSRLAARQQALLAALCGGGPAPVGSDGQRFRGLARTLVDKRRRVVAEAWPATRRALGERFGQQFAAYVAEHASPPAAGAVADGAQFVRWLTRRCAVPRAARRELLLAQLHHRWRAGIARRRRGCRISWLWLGGVPCFAIVLPFGRVVTFGA